MKDLKLKIFLVFYLLIGIICTTTGQVDGEPEGQAADGDAGGNEGGGENDEGKKSDGDEGQDNGNVGDDVNEGDGQQGNQSTNQAYENQKYVGGKKSTSKGGLVTCVTNNILGVVRSFANAVVSLI